MIPSVLAEHTRRGIEEFLRTTFPITTPFFAKVLDDLIQRPAGIFKGPYLTIRLPFTKGAGDKRFFPSVLPEDFRPYLHQELAFERIGANVPISTLIATGTGSGKTECFLYPLLDHCLRHKGEKGIKAVIIYPMNALATDQARRFAEKIWENSRLRGQLRVGLYVGGKEEESTITMEAGKVITDRDTLRKNPPDILLTNYRMLDFLLIRQADAELWRDNGPGVLRYLVVDELHSFDGAQATDLACLIRRLKHRVKVPEGGLCCVGTSATLGAGTPEGMDDLLNFATKVFDERFEKESVITEHLQSPEEFFGEAQLMESQVAPLEQTKKLDPLGYSRPEHYLDEQLRLWFDEELVKHKEREYELARRLMGHALFRNLLAILKNRTVGMTDIQAELSRIVPDYAMAPPAYRDGLVSSFTALISMARIRDQKDKEAPLLNVRCQIWMRELARMVCSVEKTPILHYSDDLQYGRKRAEEGKSLHLPLVHCRDCGLTGWAGVKKERDARLQTDLKEFYQAFFDFAPVVSFLFPGFEPPGTATVHRSHLCPRCLTLEESLTPGDCPECGLKLDELIELHNHHPRKRTSNDKVMSSHDCPRCGSSNSLTILGSRAASLIGVGIGQIFASTYNDDKKLLAFSDNVQDASHRASFFQARTYRFNLRGALAKWLKTEPEPVPLKQLAARFERYWMAQTDIFPKREKYLATFLAPDMDWLDDYEELKKTGELPQGSNLFDLLRKRLDYELWSEFCHNNRIGRTLEKSSVAVARLRIPGGAAWIETLALRLRNEHGLLRAMETRRLEIFIMGLCLELKNRGGCQHPILTPYVESFGHGYLLSQKHQIWLPEASRRLPDFLTDRSSERFTKIRSSGSGAMNWVEAWFCKCFPEALANRGAYSEIMPIILKEAVAGKLLFQYEDRLGSVWGLDSDSLEVCSEVSQLSCSTCKHAISVDAGTAKSWDGTMCLQNGCKGSYRARQEREDYYRALYDNGDIQRLFSSEHTGLLKRDVREELENDFIKGIKPASVNLLSCTPTLEMGINIGDLSSLVLCSVPPDQSNYIQRIGRAGRRDGNAFVLTVANAHPHDLFFYEDTEEMIQGLVRSPGVFLDASAVLERQFVAFVFDCWVAAGQAAVPDKIKRVLDMPNSTRKEGRSFPDNYLNYLNHNRSWLKDNFFALFAGLEQSTKERLTAFIESGGDGLEHRLVNGLSELRKERSSLLDRVRKLTDRVRRMKAETVSDQVHENELDELQREKEALNKIIHHINEKNLYNFFTDEGLLPNYAFPEAGVTLRSIIWKKKTNRPEGNEVGQYQTTIYEYERPGESAIRELAPANHFFAEGRRVQVSRVNLDMSEVENWRFCDACSYLKKVSADEIAGTCPNCGSAMWADGSQKKILLRLKQVVASTSDRDSRTRDDSDDRDSIFYIREMFVDLEGQKPLKAYRLESDEVPFGFEYLKSVGLREINFGKISFDQDEAFSINGKNFKTEGFKVCMGCGAVKIGQKFQHDFNCKFRKMDKDEEHICQSSFLYRDYHSEAIRILLPFSAGLDAERGMQSFVAALHMGLHLYFKGSPGHLRSVIYEDPDRQTGQKRRFLVLYDSVPGGSGYLKTLMDNPDRFMDVFQQAFNRLEGCACRFEKEKDGCYRCILSYRGFFTQDRVSRSEVLELFRLIVLHRGELKTVESLSGISLNALLESELEKLLIEALRHARINDKSVTIRNHVVNGKPGYYIRIGERGYRIEPQVELSEAQGVLIPSRADFVFYPDKGGRDILPIAVFTDGYTYHADKTAGHLRIGLDTAQRMALLRSGRYRVWSLTWRDVDCALKNEEHLGSRFFGHASEAFVKLIMAVDPNVTPRWKELLEQSSFRLFLEYLANPQMEKDSNGWKLLANGLLMAILQRGGLSSFESVNGTATQILNPDWEGQWDTGGNAGEAEWALCRFPEGEQDLIRGFCCIRKADARRLEMVQTAVRFMDEKTMDPGIFKDQWNGFLRLVNLCQFNPGFSFFSSMGLKQQEYSVLLQDVFVSADVQELAFRVETGELKEILNLADKRAHDLLWRINEAGLPLPVVGCELTQDKGRVLAEAELGWPEHKLAILTQEQLPTQPLFLELGWKVFGLEQTAAVPETLLTELKRGNGP